MSTQYRTLASVWNGAAHWADLIDYLRAASDDTGPNLIPLGFADNRNLTFQINDADLLAFDVSLSRYSADRKSLRLLQLLNRSYASPGAYQYQWSGRVLALDARPSPVLVTLIPWREIAAANEVLMPIFRVPGMIEEYRAELLVDIEGRASSEALLYTDNGLSTVFELDELVGATFSPRLASIDVATGAVTWVQGPTDVTISSGTIGFAAITPPNGRYAMSLKATDTWGNVDRDLFSFDIQ